MSDENVHGLSCPRCGGIVTVPEGQALIICPYCDQRSAVSAERQDSGGVRRYQVPLKVNREVLEKTFRGFVSGKVQVARDCAVKAEISEMFLVHLPFWAVWGRGVAWAFGQVKVKSDDSYHYEPREKRAVSELSWNAPACEVGDFGVQRVELAGRPLEPFDAAGLHRSGMVFEPVGSTKTALEAARAQFEQEIKSDLEMDRTEQTFVRLTRTRMGLVYYPLWVLRYLYRGRSFQVVVDGYNGEILYGKAPGSVGYRAATLVGGMAIGSVMVVDIPAALMLISTSDEDSPFVIALMILAAGAALMFGAYRTFRHGEHYEYHRHKAGVSKNKSSGLEGVLTGNLSLNNKEIENLVKTFKELS